MTFFYVINKVIFQVLSVCRDGFKSERFYWGPRCSVQSSPESCHQHGSTNRCCDKFSFNSENNSSTWHVEISIPTFQPLLFSSDFAGAFCL